MPSAVWPSSAICTLMPLSSSQRWTSASVALASSTMSGTLSRNAVDLVGDRVREQEADGHDGGDHAQHHDQHGERRADSRARRSSETNGFSSSATSAPMMNSRRTRPGGLEHRPQAEERQRQHDQLHPARDEHALICHGRVWLETRVRLTSHSQARASALACASLTTILFIGDVVGARRPARGAGPAARAARGAGDRLRRRQRRERGRRHRDHARRRRPSCSAPASTSSRSATTPTATARSGRISTSSRTSCARPTSCPRQPGRGTTVVERDGIVARRRQPQRQPLHAGGQPGAA